MAEEKIEESKKEVSLIEKAARLNLKLKKEYEGNVELYDNLKNKYWDISQIVNQPFYHMVRYRLHYVFDLSKAAKKIVSDLSVHDAIKADQLIKSK